MFKRWPRRLTVWVAALFIFGLGVAACSTGQLSTQRSKAGFTPTVLPPDTPAPLPVAASPTLVPSPPPASSTPVSLPINNTATPSVILGYHTVRAGETLYCIGRAYGMSPDGIARQNGIIDIASLRAGQQLAIPYIPWSPVPPGPVCPRQFDHQLLPPPATFAPTRSGQVNTTIVPNYQPIIPRRSPTPTVSVPHPPTPTSKYQPIPSRTPRPIVPVPYPPTPTPTYDSSSGGGGNPGCWLTPIVPGHGVPWIWPCY
jgi:LysM repeat protein